MKTKISALVLFALAGLGACGGSDSTSTARTKNAAITTTSVSAATCTVRVKNYVVTPCLPYTYMKTEWYNSTKKITNSFSTKSSQNGSPTHILTSSWLGGNPTRAYVTYTLTDGGVIGPFFVPFSANTNLTLTVNYSAPATTTTTTLPVDMTNCVLSVQNNVITPCRKFKTNSLEWWDDSKPVSGLTGGTTVSLRSVENLAEHPVEGATRVRVNFTFPDGTSTQPVFIPYPTNSLITVNAPMIAAPTTTTTTTLVVSSYKCLLSITGNKITPCKQFKSVSYQWGNSSQITSGKMSATFQNSPMTLDLSSMSPNPGTTRVIISFVLIDGKTTDTAVVAMNGGTSQLSTMAK